MSAWRGLAEAPGGFLNPLLLLAVVVAAVGTAARWWRWPGPAGRPRPGRGLRRCWRACSSAASPLPVGDAWTELRAAITPGGRERHAYPAPVPDEAPPIDPLLILGGLACLLLVDLLACTLHRVSLAGLPLLAIFAIPVGVVDGSITWWVFVATAAGFLTMLFLQESDQVTRWGRPLGEDAETGDPIAFGVGAHAVRGTAGAIGGAATALALVVPVLIPTTGLHVFDFGPGSGGRRRHPGRQPGHRPGPRPQARRGHRPGPGDDHRPGSVVPPDPDADPLHRRGVEPGQPRRARRQPRRRPAARRRRAWRPTSARKEFPYDVDGTAELRLQVAADAAADQPDRRHRRLALRRTDLWTSWPARTDSPRPACATR